MTFALKLSRRVMQGMWVVGAAAALAACAGQLTDPVGSSNSSVKTVTINPNTATVAVNSTVQLAAALRDSTGAALTGRQVIWTSAAEGVATVSATGLVRGATAGNVVIRAASEGKADSAVVTVTTDPGSGTPGLHAGYYVAPNGTSGADGSQANPWDFASALNGANGKIQPGDTVWLRAGLYKGVYVSTAHGAIGKPVV